MKKFKIVLALILGIMCTNVLSMPIKAATTATQTNEKATPKAIYDVAYVKCSGWTVIVHYQINTNSNGTISSVTINSVSSDSPAGYWGEADIQVISTSAFVWKVKFNAKIRALGFIQATGSQTVTVSSK